MKNIILTIAMFILVINVRAQKVYTSNERIWFKHTSLFESPYAIDNGMATPLGGNGNKFEVRITEDSIIQTDLDNGDTYRYGIDSTFDYSPFYGIKYIVHYCGINMYYEVDYDLSVGDDKTIKRTMLYYTWKSGEYEMTGYQAVSNE